MKISKIRKEARESLKGKWGKAALITLVYMAISFVVIWAQRLVREESAIYDIIDWAYILINVPLSFGFLISFIKLKRGEEVKSFDFFKEGFSKFKKSWGIRLHTWLKLLLPTIFLVITIIPLYVILLLIFLGFLENIAINLGITLSFDTSILKTFTDILPQLLYLLPIFIVLLIVGIIYMIRKSLLYVLAYNISYDNPEFSSKECVLKSAELMKGNRWKYFLLELSFVGWAFLAAFTWGIGLLWLTPYMKISSICFYEKLVNPEELEDDVIHTK